MQPSSAVTKSSISKMLGRYLAEHPIEPILNPIPSRMMIFGAITAVGHLAYHFAWTVVEPTAYENLWLRLFIALTGVVFMVPAFRNNMDHIAAQITYLVMVFLQVPVFFFFMYLMNEADRNWLASSALIIVALFGLTDWRLALPMLALGAGAAAGAWLLVSPPGQPNPVTVSDLVIGSFSVLAGAALGFFSASMRHLRLAHFNETMGVLAHELRTPLSANGMLAEAILDQSKKIEQPQVRASIQRLGRRVQSVTHAMNHHIDLQIINAGMRRIPKFQSRICASDLIHTTVSQYPFRSRTQRECVRIAVEKDFHFIGDEFYFAKVMDNLLGNAIKSLQMAGSNFSFGKLTLSVKVRGDTGIISVVDYGTGIKPQMLSRLFKPYSSSDRGGNHGLGLYFCKRVIEHAGGTIGAASIDLGGAKFQIALPVAKQSQRAWIRSSRAGVPSSAGLQPMATQDEFPQREAGSPRFQCNK